MPETDGSKVRLGELERRMGVVETRTDDMGVLKKEIENLKDSIRGLSDDVSSLRRALYTTALSVVGGAIAFTFTVLQVFK